MTPALVLALVLWLWAGLLLAPLWTLAAVFALLLAVGAARNRPRQASSRGMGRR